ncbi:MAG: thioredoxin domain-containing protein [Bacteroidota bacterium]
MLNRLAYEQSPYLQQHKNNPVEWYPWGDEAFAKAQEENKPVFLSIGYATCHWCHVMAHESFEDDSIAELMNESFINVKVDREERPDIDNTYMTVCQMITGHGGWPLTIIMTPGKEPFFAATYIPKEARYNRLGLRQLIPGIIRMWDHEPERVQKAIDQIKKGFNKSLEFESGLFPGTEALDFAAEQFVQRYDPDYGGFGSAPKFPSPHNLTFLAQQSQLSGKQGYSDMVLETLNHMRLGGIWDHVGFGFHRYSTDQQWLLPHFEKMLYDQALLMMAYTYGWQINQRPLFKQTVEEIAHYVSRCLTNASGGFYSAEDADSEGEEGKFYVWEQPELDALLNSEDADFLTTTFGVFPEGNFEDEATRQRTGANILHLEHPLVEKEEAIFSRIRHTLFQDREQRVHPQLDDKILTDWNALMIVALAQAGRVFDHDVFTKRALTAHEFIRNHLVENDTLYHVFHTSRSDIEGFADDYAFWVWANIELYQTTFEPRFLEQALFWNQQLIHRFWDTEHHGFFFTTEADTPLGNQKQIYDGAIPSSNSVALNNLFRLSRLTGNSVFEELLNETGQTFSTDLIRSGSSIAHGLQSIQMVHAPFQEIVLAVTEPGQAEWLKHTEAGFHPFAVFHVNTGDEALIKMAPYLEHQTPIDGKPTLYVCKNFACEQPIVGEEAIRNALRSLTAAADE